METEQELIEKKFKEASKEFRLGEISKELIEQDKGKVSEDDWNNFFLNIYGIGFVDGMNLIKNGKNKRSDTKD